MVEELEAEAIDDGIVDEAKGTVLIDRARRLASGFMKLAKVEEVKKVEIAKTNSAPKAEDTRSKRQEDGVNNIMTVISVIFSVSVLVFIGVGKWCPEWFWHSIRTTIYGTHYSSDIFSGLALPKQSERIPHMSAGPRFDDGSDDNLLIAVLKSVWWAMKTAARKKV